MKNMLISLKSCPKGYSRDLDKATSPKETLQDVKKRLSNFGEKVLAECRRVDTGRLHIPVYLSICGPSAKAVMPTRKQMGKGSSPEQAEASAIMELMERFAFFSFWENPPYAVKATWSEAEKRFAGKLLPISEILKSVSDDLDEKTARELLDLHQWLFYPATELGTEKIVWLPLDWFRMLGEFNGSSAGNTNEESLLQGVSELIERHVSAIVDQERPELPTVDLNSCHDPILQDLLDKFRKNGITLILKDISLGMPLPTVAALAWDPVTFPHDSEIVFTAGTASSPEKAAIRAITEVAQLGGDFCTNSCYEASGLPKFDKLEDIQWLLNGPEVALDSLPTVADNDIREELRQVVNDLAPIHVYAVETTHPGLGIPAHYSIAPGLKFRERDKNQSLGLFIGRKLAEESPFAEAQAGLKILAQAYPDAHFLPFFEGLILLRAEEPEKAAFMFEKALTMQPDADSRSLAAFYTGYAWTQLAEWQKAAPFLEKALMENQAMLEAANLLGVCQFKLQNYAKAEEYFDRALKIDKGSAMTLANRGMARKLQGKKQEAIHDLEAALELDHTLDFARQNLGELQNS